MTYVPTKHLASSALPYPQWRCRGAGCLSGPGDTSDGRVRVLAIEGGCSRKAGGHGIWPTRSLTSWPVAFGDWKTVLSDLYISILLSSSGYLQFRQVRRKIT
jgi:hypothetical protein